MPVAPSKLADRYPDALVTGASSGIGKAIAERLARAGMTVFGTTRHPDRAELSKEITWLQFDGSTAGGTERFLREQGALLTRVSVLINNAGASCFGKAGAIPDDILRAQQALLLGSPIRLTEHVLPSMRARGRGVIVNVSSLAALFPLPYMESYSSCKAGLSAYTQALMLTERETGLVLIDFQPGDYKTAFNRNIQRFGELDHPQRHAWKRLEENLANAPDPQQAANDLLRAISGDKSGVFRSGGIFQRVVAPVGRRLLPESVLRWGIRKYYGLS